MKLSMYQVDAFTDRVFSGNPAAVCPLEQWLPDRVLQSIASENNLVRISSADSLPRSSGSTKIR